MTPSSLRRIAQVLSAVAFAVVIGAAGLLALAFAPTLLGYESSVVTTGSMGSAAPTGSVVLTRMVDARAIGVGDIVSYRSPGRSIPVTHRVVGVSTRDGHPVFTTKGDANATPDAEPVTVNGTIARVERVIPYAGLVVRLARTPAGGLVLFVLPLVGLALDRGRPDRGRSAGPRVREQHLVRIPISATGVVAGEHRDHSASGGASYGRHAWAARSVTHHRPATVRGSGHRREQRTWSRSARSA